MQLARKPLSSPPSKGDHAKVEHYLDELVTRKAGFTSVYQITGQTYSRKLDVDIVSPLASLGCSCGKIGGDITHLVMFEEVEEPFEQGQVGSSSMAYKRNPILCERLCSIAGFLRGWSGFAMNTFSRDWMERSLHDSAIRRIMRFF